MRDYEAALKVDPENAELTKGLLNAQFQLKESLVEDVSHMTIGPEVREVTTVEQFVEAISIPGKLSIYHLLVFKPMDPGIRSSVLIWGQYQYNHHTPPVTNIVY